jgi:dienelactone hydrolase
MYVSRFRAMLVFGFALLAVDAGANDRSAISIAPVGSSVQIPATLIRPDGGGPFPAVVIMHDCSGLGPRASGAPERWGEELVQQGYVVVIPDSFSTRGFPAGVCLASSGDRSAVSGYARAADAYGALAMLRALPYVDAKHVGIMGGSHGGWTTLAAMFYVPPDPANALAEAKANGFAAAIALYPGCAPRYGTWSTTKDGTTGPATGHSGVYRPIAPLLILIGEKDDWTPAQICRELAETSRAAGYPVDIKIYPGAFHSFDSDHPVRFDERRNNASAASGRGATTGGNPVAWADAKKHVVDFFARYLKSQ